MAAQQRAALASFQSDPEASRGSPVRRSLRSIESIGLNEQFSGVNEQVWRLLFLRPSCRGNFSPYFRRELSVAGQRQGKAMVAGRRIKTVAFVAILAVTTFEASPPPAPPLTKRCDAAGPPLDLRARGAA
jgi:hypothetical protein